MSPVVKAIAKPATKRPAAVVKRPVPPVASKRRKIHLSTSARLLAYVVGLLVLLAVGNLFQNVDLGDALVVVYGVAAIIFRIPSSDTFRLLLANVAYIMLFTLLRNATLAGIFTQYALLLLCFGIVSMLIEGLHLARKSKINLKNSQK